MLFENGSVGGSVVIDRSVTCSVFRGLSASSPTKNTKLIRVFFVSFVCFVVNTFLQKSPVAGPARAFGYTRWGVKRPVAIAPGSDPLSDRAMCVGGWDSGTLRFEISTSELELRLTVYFAATWLDPAHRRGSIVLSKKCSWDSGTWDKLRDSRLFSTCGKLCSIENTD